MRVYLVNIFLLYRTCGSLIIHGTTPSNILTNLCFFNGFVILHGLKYFKKTDTFFLISRWSLDHDVIVKMFFLQNIEKIIWFWSTFKKEPRGNSDVTMRCRSMCTTFHLLIANNFNTNCLILVGVLCNSFSCNSQ